MKSSVKFYETVLPNGLKVIGEQRNTAVSVAVSFFVRTGARDEGSDLLGVSHFLEHMMFKGTATRSALDITYQLGALGAQANAYTTEEMTVYYVAVLPEYFTKGLELLSDMLRPNLDPSEFDTEKKVILEEIALYQDRPLHVLFDATLQEYFSGHDAGNPVLGTTETIAALPRDAMKSYFDRRYVPSNMILGASGCFDWQEFVSLAAQYCSNWTRGECSRVVKPHSPVPSERVLTKEKLQRAHLSLVAPGPSATDQRRHAAQVLGCILGDSSGSRVYWELVDPGLADYASIDTEDMDGTGMIYGYVSGDPDRIDDLGNTLAKILKTPRDFSDEDLNRAKTKIGTALVLQGESTMRRLMAIGHDSIYRDCYITLAEELAEVQAISRADIETLLEEFPFTPVTRVKLIPA